MCYWKEVHVTESSFLYNRIRIQTLREESFRYCPMAFSCAGDNLYKQSDVPVPNNQIHFLSDVGVKNNLTSESQHQ